MPAVLPEIRWALYPAIPAYQVSTNGTIIGRVGKLLTCHLDDAGYQRVNMIKDGKTRKIRVHRAVAETFLPNPDNLPVVNHINGVRDDNKIGNLEWVTHKQNSERTVIRRDPATRFRKIVQLTPDGGLVKIWDSLTEAAGGKHSVCTKISACCR